MTDNTTDPTLTLEVLIESKKRFNQHVYIDTLFLQAYIRKTTRYFSKKRVHVETLEIGSVSVEKNERRKGYFKKFLEKFEKIAKYG